MKNTQVGNDSENEFDVDEPDEIQNNASDDDWQPEATGRRQSTRLRGSARPTFAEVSTSEEEFSEDEDFESEEENRKRRSKQKRGGRQVKRARVTSTTNENSDSQGGDVENKSVNNSDSEPSSTFVMGAKVGKEFSSGSFVVLKTDLANEGDPPLWKIDGKALLQKYIPFEEDGKTYYKNTSVYSGWTVNNKDQYYPATVTFKQQNRKEHIIEFKRDLIKVIKKEKENGEQKPSSPAAEEEEDEDDEEEEEEEEEDEEEDEEEEAEEEDEQPDKSQAEKKSSAAEKPEKSPAEEPEKSPVEEIKKSTAKDNKSPSNPASPEKEKEKETAEDKE